MSKSETLQQLAAASNTARIEELSQQTERLRQAKLSSAEELAAILEPLAQAMAALTDETRASLMQINQCSKEQGEQFQAQIASATQAWNAAASAARDAALQLDSAGRRMEWHHYLLAGMTGMLAGLLTSVFWLWLAPAPTIQNLLDPKAIAELLRPEIAALKPHKGK